MKGFKVVNYISFSFPKLLGAIDATSVAKQIAKFASVAITDANTEIADVVILTACRSRSWRPRKQG